MNNAGQNSSAFFSHAPRQVGLFLAADARHGKRETEFTMYRRRVGLSNQEAPPRLLTSLEDTPPRRLKVPRAFDDPPVSSDDEEKEEDEGEEEEKQEVRARDGPEPGMSSHEGVTGNGYRVALPHKKQTRTPRESGASNGRISWEAGLSRTRSGASYPLRAWPRREWSGIGDVDGPVTATQAAADGLEPRGKRRRLDEKTTTTASVRDADEASAGEEFSTPPPSSGEHLTDERGFTKVRASKLRYKNRATQSQSQSQSQSDKDSRGSAMSSMTRLRVPEPFISPKKAAASKLLVPRVLNFSPQAKGVSGGQGGGLSGDSTLEDAHADSMTATTSRSWPCSQESESGLGPRPGQAACSSSPSPPPAVFKLPRQVSDLGGRRAGCDGRSDVVLPVVVSTDSGGDDGSPTMEAAAVEGRGKAAAKTASCPWCGEGVDGDWLEEFAKGKRMNVRMQTQFCRQHRRRRAMEAWRAKGYPEVEWAGLSRRFSEHHDFLLAVVHGRASHFRSVLAEQIERGQARCLKKEENLNPGYYGPRGFNLMCDYLVEEFGDLLKKKAIDDWVIAGRGSAAFIQSVLVAELAVQLIKEDMGVSASEAGRIMEESKGLGEIVHEDS